MFKYHDCKKKNKFNCHELSVWIHSNTGSVAYGEEEEEKQNKHKKINVLWCLIISFPAYADYLPRFT